MSRRIALAYAPASSEYPRHKCMVFVFERNSARIHCIGSQYGATAGEAIRLARFQASNWLKLLRKAGTRIP